MTMRTVCAGRGPQRAPGPFLWAVAVTLGWSAIAFAADTPVVRVVLRPSTPVVVGQPVTAIVQVLVPNFFLSAPDWPILDIDGAIVTMSDEVMPHLSETIHGQSYVGVQQAYTITPGQEGEFTLPAVDIRFQYAAVPGQPPADGMVSLPQSRIVARWPAGERTDDGVLPVARLTVHQTLDRSLDGLKTGDTITRTIAVSAAHTQPMMIPPPNFDAPKGVRIYRKNPDLSTETGTRGDLVAGRRVDRATYMFLEPGHYTLPAITYPWFDTVSNTRRTAEGPAIVVDVVPNPAAAAIAPEPPPAAPASAPPTLWQTWKARLPWLVGTAAALLAIAWAVGWIWPKFRRWHAARRQARAESEKAAFDIFQHACESNDRAKAYASLARWASRAGHASIGYWCSALGHEPFTAAVGTLERELFATPRRGHSVWNGAPLKQTSRAARSAWRSRASRGVTRAPALPRLNPRWAVASAPAGLERESAARGAASGRAGARGSPVDPA